MNCPSRTEPVALPGHNQSPNLLAAELTTRQDLSGIANSRVLRRIEGADEHLDDDPGGVRDRGKEKDSVRTESQVATRMSTLAASHFVDENGSESGGRARGKGGLGILRNRFMKLRSVVMTFGKFVGPGFMVRSQPNTTPSISF